MSSKGKIKRDKIEALNPINCYSVGLIFTDEEIQEMVQEADIDGDQHVSFDEFRDIFFES